MAEFREKHSFARQILAEKNLEISDSKGNIMLPPLYTPLYNYKPEQPKLKIGLQIAPREIMTLESYQDLVDEGFVIVSTKVTLRKFHKQQVTYKLTRKDEVDHHTEKVLPTMPPGHIVYWNTSNDSYMLHGLNSDDMWISKMGRRAHSERRVNPYSSKSMVSGLKRYSEKYRIIKNDEGLAAYAPISELPIMVSKCGKIVCLPDEDVEPRITIVGESGSGKCVCGDTRIFLDNKLVSVREIFEKKEEYLGKDVITINPQNLKVEKNKLLSIEANQENTQKITIETCHGRKICCSPNHKFPILNEELDYIEKRADEISDRDSLIALRSYPIITQIQEGEYHVRKREELLNRIKRVIDADIYLDKVYSIEKSDCFDEMYDLAIENNHNYLTEDGIFTCNSFLVNSIVGRAYWHKNKRIILMNDIMKECGCWNLAWDDINNSDMIEKLYGNLNEKSIPLPTVHFAYQFRNLPDDYLDEYSEVGFKSSLPYKLFLSDTQAFLEGNPKWKLGKTEKYITSHEDKFEMCESVQDIVEVITDLEANREISKESASKALSVIADIFKEDILDMTNKIDTVWVVRRIDANEHKILEEKVYPPAIACLYAGLVPVITTSVIFNRPYFPMTFRHIANQILRTQTEDKYFKGNDISIWAIIDEVRAICAKRKPTVASEAMEEFASMGRARRMGMIFITQSYQDLLDAVRQNSRFCMALSQKKKAAKAISDDYDLSDTNTKALQNLEKFEFMAMTKDTFITYDSQGRRKEEKGPFRGYSLTPLNRHKKPKK